MIRINRFFLTLAGLGGLVGIVSLIYRLIEGMKVTALTTHVPWGMWVAFYIYFIGLSAGSFLFSTLIYVFGQRNIEKAGRLALVSAVLALIAGVFFIWIDLGHPWRAIYVFTHWNRTSMLAWEILFYVFYTIVMLAELWFLMRLDLAYLRDNSKGWRRSLYGLLALGTKRPKDEEEFQRRNHKIVSILGVIGIPLAIGVHGGTGAIFAVVKARPYWYSPVFPIIFLVSALVSGAALMTFLYAVLGKREDPDYTDIVRTLFNWMLLFLAVDILLMIAEFLVGLYGNIPDHVYVLHAILFGKYWYVFWIGQFTMAMLIPILVAIFARNSVKALAFAALCAVIGIINVRFNLVIPAFVVPPIPGMERAFVGERFVFSYFPSLAEWISSAGIISLVIFFFSLALEYLPVYSLFENSKREVIA